MYRMSQIQLNTIHANCQDGTQAHGDEFYEPIMKVIDELKSEELFLLITENKHIRQVKLFTDPVEAEQAARAWVGDHNPIDGCSTEAHAESFAGPHGTRFYVSRSTSFGIRRAEVYPVGTAFEQELRR
jgi:hypothetical protein